jgi:hypothetical protein
VAYVASILTGTHESLVDRLHRNPVPSSSVAAELLMAMTVGPRLLVRDLQRLRDIVGPKLVLRASTRPPGGQGSSGTGS